MKRSLTILLALSLVLGLLAGCAPVSTTGTTTGTTGGTTTGTTTTGTVDPSVEQTMRLTYGPNLFNTYDFRYPWGDVGLVQNLLWLTLIQADKNLNAAKGQIMSDWTVSDDGLTFTFTMREDLLWSDGTPITMDDVTWTFDRLSEHPYSPYVNSALNYIEGRQAYMDGEADTVSGISADGNVLTIQLTEPYASFLNLMAQVAPLPKHIYENSAFADDGFKTDPIWETVEVNSGPFVVTDHVKDNYFVMEHNPHYKGETPIITKIINTKTADVTAQAQSGDVDMIGTNSGDHYEIFSDLSAYRLIPIPIIFFRFFVFNFFDASGNEKTPVRDIRVRQAFAKAVDWEALIGGLFGELASFTQSGVLSNSDDYLGDWYGYDPVAAKQLLDDADFDYNHTLKVFYYYTDQTSIDVMDAVAYYLDQIGVKMEAVYTSQSIADIYEGRTHDIAYFGLSAYDELSWYQMYLRPMMDNMIGSIDVFQDAVKALETAYTPELWQEAITKLQELERETVFYLPVYTLNYQVWLHERLSVPDDIFGNNWYFYDYQFEKWQIVQ